MYKDVTMFIAHADDEAIFLWPFLERTKKIVCASSDRFNPDRKWCSMRGDCLREVGKLIGAEVEIMDYNSEFYRLPTRNGELFGFADKCMDLLKDADIIATHNAHGEYGNLDHILCHHIGRTIQARTGIQLLVSDIATEINWLPVTRWHQGGMVVVPPKEREIDRPLFERIKGIYDARGCWTWAWEPAETCRVYSL